MRMLIALAVITSLSCTSRAELPRLCVSSVSEAAPIPDCVAGGAVQAEQAELVRGQQVLVQHALPQDIDPYGHEVNITFGQGAFEEKRTVGYGEVQADGGTRRIARTVFDYPDAGPCLFTIHAQILNSELTVTGVPDDCD